MAPRRTRSRNTSSGTRGHPYRSGGTRTSAARVRVQSNRSQVTRTTVAPADLSRGPMRTRAQRSGVRDHSFQPRGQRSGVRVHGSQPRGPRSGRNAINGDSTSPATEERSALSAAQNSVRAQSGNVTNSSTRRSSRVRADAATNERRRDSRIPPAATRRSSRLRGMEGTSSSPSQSNEPVNNDTTRSNASATSDQVLHSLGTAGSNIPTGEPPPQVAQQGNNNGIQEQGNQQNGNGPTPTPLLSTGRFSAYYVGRANHFYSDLLSLTPQPTRDRGNSGYNLRRRWATRSPTDRGGPSQPRSMPPRPVERAPAPPVSPPPPSSLRDGPVTRSQARLRQASQGTVWRQGRFRIRHPGPVEPGHEEDSMQHAMDMLTDLSSPNNTRDEDTMSESSNGSDRSGIPGEALPENFLGFGPEFWQGRRLVSIRFVRDHSILDYFPATGNMYISSLDEPPRGLTPQEVESIPYRNFARNEEAKTCSICIVNYRTGNRVKTLPCSHEFHEACIKRWLREHENCPTCRQPVREADSAEAGAAAADAGAPPGNNPAPSGDNPSGNGAMNT
ncbi:RLIM [Branchiostoma lanceolatum]|uniref:RLIM protein n=1 Tax=Branchiostoma lanceolatum TaxID=7740 RepID=A0A8K0A419_BRALA|nr:RLIM [Branchiostoma lanceolatum]